MSNFSVMIDLETMGTSPRAAIVQIAAVEFDTKTFEIGGHIDAHVSLQSSLDAGLVCDERTIRFWMGQKDRPWMDGEQVSLARALQWLNCRFNWPKVDNVWSHASFDMPILRSAFDACGMDLLFSYRNAMDLRTVFALAGFEKKDMEWLPEDGVKHDALADCWFQIRMLKMALERIAGI